MSSSLPEPRPLTPADAPAAGEAARALELALGYEGSSSAEALLEWWLYAELETGSWLFEERGRILGFGWIFERGGVPDGGGFVHPDAFGRGVGSALLDRYERWARKRGFGVLHTEAYGRDARAHELVRARGFHEARRFYEMLIDLDGEPPAPAWPSGIRPAAFRREDAPAFHAATNEAFAQEWGFAPMEFQEWFDRRVDGADTSYYFLAWDGTEVAGALRGDAKRANMGWVNTVAVRPAWRRRGLARALLLHAFAEFHGRGLRRVGLGVDTQNPTGATRLYESAGMRVSLEDVVFEKRLG